MVEDDQTREVVETNTENTGRGVRRETVHSVRGPEPSGTVLLARLAYWLLGLIETILAFRVVLSLLGANRSNPFAQFIYNISLPFAQPFFSLFGYEPTYGASHLEVGTVVAMIVYAIIVAGIVSLLRLPRRGTDV